MKTILQCILFIGLIISIPGLAQGPGDSKPLASKTTKKGRRELRKEERIKKREMKHERKENREAAKKNNKAMNPTDVTKGTKRKRHRTSANRERKGML